ncbi:MAG: DUF5329 domain-containing protein [Pseudomonadota bacterium]|nr:DUF5329 domain-containing protein [Pseudomonadota bacterium]
MKRRCFVGLTLTAGLQWTTAGYAAPPKTVQAEVDALLASIETSGCAFYRNGTLHDSKDAAAHLRDKYDYFAARGLIVTTEDFIERAATKSSLSGQPYEVTCGDGAAVSSKQWLRDKLAQLRAS